MGSVPPIVLTLLCFLGLSLSAAAGPLAFNIPINPADLQQSDDTQSANITGSLLVDVKTINLTYAPHPRNIY